MRQLHHFTLCPFSRKARILLAEKGVIFDLIKQKYWQPSHDLLALNPSAELPILVEQEKVIAGNYAVTEYLEEHYTEKTLLGEGDKMRAEVRRIAAWFDQKCYYEVTRYIINEKLLRYYRGTGQPSSEAIRAAKINLQNHMRYLSFLLGGDSWLSFGQLTLADISAAAQISVLDYFGEIEWGPFPEVKAWYALIKSRPSVKPILQDRVSGFLPPKHYANPDF